VHANFFFFLLDTTARWQRFQRMNSEIALVVMLVTMLLWLAQGDRINPMGDGIGGVVAFRLFSSNIVEDVAFALQCTYFHVHAFI